MNKATTKFKNETKERIYSNEIMPLRLQQTTINRLDVLNVCTSQHRIINTTTTKNQIKIPFFYHCCVLLFLLYWPKIYPTLILCLLYIKNVDRYFFVDSSHKKRRQSIKDIINLSHILILFWHTIMITCWRCWRFDVVLVVIRSIVSL